MVDMYALIVEKWTVAYAHEPRAALLRFDCPNREPIILAMRPEMATEMARVMLAQEKNPPPKSNRLS
jgi:hypothetical protein